MSLETNYASLFVPLMRLSICATRSEQPLPNPIAAGGECGEPLMPQLLSSSSSPRIARNPGWWWWCPALVGTPLLHHQRLPLVPLFTPVLFSPTPFLPVPSFLLLLRPFAAVTWTGKGRHRRMDSESPRKRIPESTPPPCLAPVPINFKK